MGIGAPDACIYDALNRCDEQEVGDGDAIAHLCWTDELLESRAVRRLICVRDLW